MERGYNMKLRTLIIISILAVSALSCEFVFTTALDEQWGDRVTYQVGDRGPAGGWIFYINPNYEEDGWMYLEAAPAVTEANGPQWTSYTGEDETVGTLSGVGYGFENTRDILEWADSIPTSAPAAEYCNNLMHNDYKDWFLPSLNELIRMEQNLYNNGDIGGFLGNSFWSSTESSLNTDRYAYTRDFDSHITRHNVNKGSTGNSCLVRCARRFQGEIY